jgi:hypothetical protein
VATLHPWSDLPPHARTRWNEVTGERTDKDPFVEAAGHASATGQRYWVDPVTGDSTWEQPAEYAWSEAASPEHPGRSYFFNSVTSESTWERPAALSWRAAEKGWWSNNVTGESRTTEPEAMGFLNEEGKRYWVVSGKSTWTPPTEFAWTEYHSAENNGRSYFFNSVTNATQWERPASLGWSRRSYNRTHWQNYITGEKAPELPKHLVHNGKGAKPPKAAWEKRVESGKDVYVNSVTKEKAMEVPADSNLAWQKYVTIAPVWIAPYFLTPDSRFFNVGRTWSCEGCEKRHM